MDKSKNLKKTATTNLIIGYMCAIAFMWMILANLSETNNNTNEQTDVVIVEKNNTITKTVYVDTQTGQYTDHLRGAVQYITTDVDINRPDDINIVDENIFHDRIVDRDRDWNDVVERVVIDGHVVGDDRDYIGGRHRGHHMDVDGDVTVTSREQYEQVDTTDYGLLDRRLKKLDDVDVVGLNVKSGVDLDNLRPVTDSDGAELGDISEFDNIDVDAYGVGTGAQLYAYNFPSRGVGAGIGTGGIGAGSGAGAGLGAGIGEGMLKGESVPTLGGVGTYTLPGAEIGSGSGGGVGGLVGGAGAGGAAGLYTGRVIDMLGVGKPGGGGIGTDGYNYDHLPKNGALHIMMHVDGSGSILNTRKQLDIMKDTVLKAALLPYYNNDVDLYNRRVTIVDGSGERTLKFFTQAAKKDNVLAVVFQDEAQPAYHLPNFNKTPEDHYIDDLEKLKESLNGYNGVYRGVMFQVDRGKTFAKSFKEFVGNAFNGEGYLKGDNLKKYHRDNNTNYIKNRNGVIFSDEYHAKDSGDPQYYLDLIFRASKRIGLDLDIFGAGLTDGKHNNDK